MGRVHRYTARVPPPSGRGRGGGDAGSLLPGVLPPNLVHLGTSLARHAVAFNYSYHHHHHPPFLHPSCCACADGFAVAALSFRVAMRIVAHAFALHLPCDPHGPQPSQVPLGTAWVPHMRRAGPRDCQLLHLRSRRVASTDTLSTWASPSLDQTSQQMSFHIRPHLCFAEERCPEVGRLQDIRYASLALHRIHGCTEQGGNSQ